MIHLRPQRVYKPTTSSGNPNNSIANYLDRYYNQGLYRLRLETPRGTSLAEDNSQITCYAHFFNNTDGSEVTDRLKGRGFRPTWLLNDKSIDSTCISEDGYLLTLDSAHLTDYTQTVTLQALDTEILSALSDEPQFDLWLQQTLKGQGIQPTLLKQSETLINFALVNKERNESINKLLEDLTAHPLTVSKDGHWRIWDALKKTYITTEYLSRGPKGDKGDKPKLSLDDKLRLLADGELVSMASLKGPKGDPGDRGAKGDKGDKPKLSLDDKLRLLADGELVSMVSLKGPKGDPGDRGAKGDKGEPGQKGDKGDKPNLSLDDKLRLLADGELVSMVSLKGPKGDPGDRGAKGDKGEPGQKGDKGEKGDKPSLEDVLDSQKFKELVTTPFYNDLSITNQYIENAFTHINNIFTTMASDRTYTITSSGYVSSRIAQTCPNISKDYAPKHVECNIPRAEPQIRLVTYSAYESLKSQVEMLTSKLAQLEARTSVTPITNTDLRQDFDDAYSFRISLYPKYGDWLLTSDSKEQNISFAGLKAEVGRSIYIQTRKRAYLYANGHSFYGLPGSSTSENQWLSNNTTYRFVRASSTSWCVTSSSSPYPWT